MVVVDVGGGGVGVVGVVGVVAMVVFVLVIALEIFFVSAHYISVLLYLIPSPQG